MKTITLVSLALSLLVVGCTSARISKSLASGAVGCPIDEVQITNETATIEGLHNFTATCDGVDYFCSYMYPNPINCKQKNVKTLVATPPVIENKITINNNPAQPN